MEFKITKTNAKELFLLNNKELDEIPSIDIDNYHNFSRKVKLYNYIDLKNKSCEKFGDIDILIKLRNEKKNKRDDNKNTKILNKENRKNKIMLLIKGNNYYNDIDINEILNEFPIICFIENDLRELKKYYLTIDINSDIFLDSLIKRACDRIRRRNYIKNISNNTTRNPRLVNEYINNGNNTNLFIEGTGC